MTLGFRVKSGYAIAIALQGPASSPTAIARQVVELSDPKIGGTRQPYHHGFFRHEKNANTIARLVKIVERCATESVSALLDDLPGARRAGLVVGSVIDPAQVGNLHIRAHASEGRLFRTVVEDALRAHGVSCTIVVDKQLATTAATELRCGERAIKQTIGDFGKTIGGSWRADDKAAALAAWLSLTNDLTLHRALN